MKQHLMLAADFTQRQQQTIAKAKYVSNPGCYATGAVLALKPLTANGLLKDEQQIAVHAVSGYTGGGRQMVEKYQQADEQNPTATLGLYGLDFNHKHTKEIFHWAGLNTRPVFIPSVANYAQGMLVQQAIDLKQLQKPTTGKALHALYQDYYQGSNTVNVMPLNDKSSDNFAPLLSPHGIEGSNLCQLYIYVDEDYQQALIVAKLDNLGKGASGAAVQNLDLMLSGM
mgnify:CR=1 FL=1